MQDVSILAGKFGPAVSTMASWQITATNQIRGLLTQIHPALKRALGPHLEHPAVADLLTRNPAPEVFEDRRARHVKARLKTRSPNY